MISSLLIKKTVQDMNMTETIEKDSGVLMDMTALVSNKGTYMCPQNDDYSNGKTNADQVIFYLHLKTSFQLLSKRNYTLIAFSLCFRKGQAMSQIVLKHKLNANSNWMRKLMMKKLARKIPMILFYLGR